MLRVKNQEWFIRQFPNRIPVWGNCEFSFDQAERNYDWLVVYDDLAPSEKSERFSKGVESLACHPDNTLLITAEPSCIKTYGRQFTQQFGHVLTSQEPWAIDHPGVIRSQSGYVWFYGRSQGGYRDYDQMAAFLPEKTKPISTVCSSKKQRHTLHHYRYAFTQQLKSALPELEIYGHGVKPMDDKAESLDDYECHLAIENHPADHHWTEKLSDTFLGLAYPFYFGAPNVYDYFPEESLTVVPINQPAVAIELIQKSLRDISYAEKLPVLQEARRKVLEEYNLFAVLSKIIEERHQTGGQNSGKTLLSRRLARKKALVSYFFESLSVRSKAQKAIRTVMA